MACAYTGNILMPSLFGFIADMISISLYPLYLAALAALMLVMSERVNRVVNKNMS